MDRDVLRGLVSFGVLVPSGAFDAIASAAERPALIEAAKNADREALRALIHRKANVNEADADGTTALHWASYRDDLDSVDLLLRAGAERGRRQRSRRDAILEC